MKKKDYALKGEEKEGRKSRNLHGDGFVKSRAHSDNTALG